MDAIIESYAQLVLSGRKKMEDVPSGLQSMVKDRVIKIENAIQHDKEASEERVVSEV